MLVTQGGHSRFRWGAGSIAGRWSLVVSQGQRPAVLVPRCCRAPVGSPPCAWARASTAQGQAFPQAQLKRHTPHPSDSTHLSVQGTQVTFEGSHHTQRWGRHHESYGPAGRLPEAGPVQVGLCSIRAQRPRRTRAHNTFMHLNVAAVGPRARGCPESRGAGTLAPTREAVGPGPVSAWTLYSQGRGDNTLCHTVSPRTKRVTEQGRGFPVSTAFDGTLDTHHLCKTQKGKV